MPVVINGRSLGVAENGIFTEANTDPIPGGKLWPEAARAWNDMRTAAIADGIQPWEFVPAGPRSSARGRPDQDWFWAHQPPPAAPPYTSNHGWAIAVDVKTRRAVAWMQGNAHRFGFSHDEGVRVGEWWHWRYIGGYRPRSDALAHLTRTERRWCRELDKLRREGRDLKRRQTLVRVLTQQRKRIWHEAQTKAKGGDGLGWDVRNRRKRYRSLLARTT